MIVYIKNSDPDWYNKDENFVENKIEDKKINLHRSEIKEDFENQDLMIEEVTSAIAKTNLSSAPCPEEKIFTILIKKGGETVAKALLLLFQKCWCQGTICDSFKIDPKILMPKPGKENYNSTRSYRPITLESIISKIFQRTIAGRLIWRLEVSNGFANTQDAYRKQHSGTQSMIRVINSLQVKERVQCSSIHGL